MCLLLGAATAASAAVNTLVNPSFNDGANGWEWGPGIYAASISPTGYPLYTTPHEGTRVAQLYTLAENTVWTSQLVTSGVAAGQTWTFSGYVMNSAEYPADVDSFGRVRIEYVGGGGGEFTLLPDIQSSIGAWIPFSLTASSPTPEGVTGVRFWAEFAQSQNNYGILLFDDMSAISEVPEAGTTGLIAAGVAGLAAVVRGVRRRRV